MFNFEKKDIDMLAVGDITVDAFIRLKDASVNCNIDNHNCQICMKYGEKLPYEFTKVLHAVGNSPNAAVSSAKLSLSSALITTLGNDDHGRDCLFTLSRNKVNTDFINIDHEHPTNFHYVLWYESDRTILVKHENYNYDFPKNLPPVKYIYLSSLGESGKVLHDEVLKFLNDHPETKLAFQPGTFQIKMGIDKLKEIYAKTSIFVCNLEEARTILSDESGGIKTLLDKMHDLGPEMVIITDGPKGAYAYDGKSKYFVPIYPDQVAPYERTGCGDAFASTFVSMIIKGKTFEEALLYAPVNPMSVIQKVGAQEGLLDQSQIESFLSKAPEDYKLVYL